LESPSDLTRLSDAESYLLQRKDQLIIIDEVQRKPELFPILRSVIDQNRKSGRFILLGSASPELLLQSSESLAGRAAYLELQPLSFEEVRPEILQSQLFLRGGFPEMLLAASDIASLERRNDFIQTYIEKELPLLGLGASPILMKNMLRMLSHVHGQILNYSELSRSLGIHISYVKHYIDYLEHAFLIRRLQPYYINIGKRLVKSPKIYIRDSGLLHALAGIETSEELEGYIGKGASWEGFVIQQIITYLRPLIQPYFYRTQDGTELDMLLVKGNQPVLGIEVKYTNAPDITRGITLASMDLGNLPVWIVIPNASESYYLKEKIQVVPLAMLRKKLEENALV
jgi:predicted AAA+ superfamily ATPase